MLTATPKQKKFVAALIALAVCTVGCATGKLVRVGQNNDSLGSALVRVKDTVETDHKAGKMSDADYDAWKSGLGKSAYVVTVVNKWLQDVEGADVPKAVDEAL